MFIIPDGAPGALAELERRKFTAEEGVSLYIYSALPSTNVASKDHLTLLNGMGVELSTAHY